VSPRRRAVRPKSCPSCHHAAHEGVCGELVDVSSFAPSGLGAMYHCRCGEVAQVPPARVANKRALETPAPAPSGCSRCAGPVRSVAEVAAELRTWTPSIRAEHLRHEEAYAAKYPPTAPGPRELNENSDRYVAYCADIHLPALALELDSQLCWCCAYGVARRFVHLRRLVFEGLLADFRTSGRDERAEEEFQLQTVAA
jgi:hypothetical protein